MIHSILEDMDKRKGEPIGRLGRSSLSKEPVQSTLKRKRTEKTAQQHDFA
jgi:hypothetical protein